MLHTAVNEIQSPSGINYKYFLSSPYKFYDTTILF